MVHVNMKHINKLGIWGMLMLSTCCCCCCILPLCGRTVVQMSRTGERHGKLRPRPGVSELSTKSHYREHATLHHCCSIG